MSTRFHVGAKSLQGSIAAYAKRFDLLEVAVTVDAPPASKGAPKGTKPKPKVTVAPKPATGAVAMTPTLVTLKRWRKQVPPHFHFTVVAGPALSRVKDGPELERDFEATMAAVAALQARCLLVRTVADVTPSVLWRERLEKLFSRFPRDVTHVIWEPSGIWETGDAAVAAKKWSVVVSVDASREPVPAGAVAYTRLRALGETRSFGESTLERIVRSIGVRREVFVVLETESALEECKRLRRIAQRAKASATGGMGRLVRPRGGIVVRDDEQE